MNSGLQARIPVEKLKSICNRNISELLEGKFADDTTYIVESEYIEQLDTELRDQLTERRFQHYSVLARKADSLGRHEKRFHPTHRHSSQVQ